MPSSIQYNSVCKRPTPYDNTRMPDTPETQSSTSGPWANDPEVHHTNHIKIRKLCQPLSRSRINSSRAANIKRWTERPAEAAAALILAPVARSGRIVILSLEESHFLLARFWASDVAIISPLLEGVYHRAWNTSM